MAEYTTADITTDRPHENFITAKSVDGKYSWHNAQPGYVLDIAANNLVYLQYGLQDTDAETLAEMRSFSRAVTQIKTDRRNAREARQFDEALAESRRARLEPTAIEACTLYTRDQGCPLHGELCAPEYR